MKVERVKEKLSVVVTSLGMEDEWPRVRDVTCRTRTNKNRNVYFELRKFPLDRDKGGAQLEYRRKFMKTRQEFPNSEEFINTR